MRCVDCLEGRECYRECPDRERGSVESVLDGLVVLATDDRINRVFDRLKKDEAMLDWLERQNAKGNYTGRCVFRWSTTGRGWRLHESSAEHGYSTVREAIRAAMENEASE